jgi:hypothetical protein
MQGSAIFELKDSHISLRGQNDATACDKSVIRI